MRRPRIRTSYSEITWIDPEADHYEEDHGWIDEEGYEVMDDVDPDPDWGPDNIIEAAVDFLEKNYVTESSNSPPFFHPGTWYSAEPEEDYSTGARTTKSFHLVDFTEAEEKAVFDEFWRRHRERQRKWATSSKRMKTEKERLMDFFFFGGKRKKR